MALKMTQNEINWIVNEYNLGRSIEEISVDTGASRQNIKRALAEAGILNLSWYKTKKEQEMLNFLYSKGITSVFVLQNQMI